jgi:uncharacterized protein (TIGR00266 family)
MQISVDAKPSYAMATVVLEAGEELIAESGSMVAMSPAIEVATTFNGAGGGDFVGWLRAAVIGIARKYLAGETLFVNRFTATNAGQQVMLSPGMVGDVVHQRMDGTRTLVVQATSYLASSPDVAVRLVWGGWSMLLSGEGAFFLECTGRGDLLINSYGAIEKVEVDGQYIVDSGHVVAFEGDLDWTLRRAGGGWRTTLLSGEGFVQEFTGRGTLWLQTRHLGSFVSWITPMLP